MGSCDNEAGQVCPTSEGKEIGECLKDPTKHILTDIDGNPRELEPGEKPMELSDDCKSFININEACDADIAEHCQGMYFHGDTMMCLTTWTKPEMLSAGCSAALPKKKDDDEEIDAEKAAWRAQRKAVRDQAKKDIKKEQDKQEKAKKKKSRKAKKNKEL